MSLGSCYSDYDKFAWVYNKHWGNRFTPTALPVLEKLALPFIQPNADILDLCCGTGQLAQILTERGYRVTGLDGSEEMLRFARKNAPNAKFILGDARTFKLPDIYRLVISMFDSLNHVMTYEELSAVFLNVHVALQEGGLFLVRVLLLTCVFANIFANELFSTKQNEGREQNDTGFTGLA